MITEPELQALRNWLWQLARHKIPNVEVVIGPRSQLLVTALRGLAMKAVAPKDGPACPHCGSGGNAPCCRYECDGLQCVHCLAQAAAARTPEQELELAKKLLQDALGEPGGVRDTEHVNYALAERIEAFLAPRPPIKEAVLPSASASCAKADQIPTEKGWYWVRADEWFIALCNGKPNEVYVCGDELPVLLEDVSEWGPPIYPPDYFPAPTIPSPESIDISDEPVPPSECTDVTAQTNEIDGSVHWHCKVQHENGSFAGIYAEDGDPKTLAIAAYNASLPMVYYALRRARQLVTNPATHVGMLMIATELTDLGQVDTSECPAGWEPTGDGGLCYGNRKGEATSFVFARNGNVEIVQGDEGAAAPAAVVRYALGMPADPTGVDARALYWQKQFSLTCEANTALSREVIRLTEALIEANSKNADKNR